MTRRRSRVALRVLGAFSAALVAGLLILAVAFSPARLVETARLMRAIAETGSGAATAAALEPTVMEYRANGARMADLYGGSDTAKAALVLVPGAAPRGRRDPRLMAFARTLARFDFLVLVPEPAGADPVRVSARDVGPIADAVRYLASRYDLDDLGIAAISYAAGPALIAAMDPAVAERVGFMLIIGGYYDMDAAVTYLTTGAYRGSPRDDWRRGPVDDRAKWRFLLANADRVGGGDYRLLRRIALDRLGASAPLTKADIEALSPAGQAVLRLLTNGNPHRVPALLAALPARLRDALAALDISRRDLSQLRSRLILIHGRDDPMVPHTETLALERALPDGQADSFIVDRLVHVDLAGLDIGDAVTLFRAGYLLLSQRDRADAPARNRAN